MKAQNELINTSPKEQIEFIQGQIDKMRYSVEDRKSQIAWQTVNEVKRRKSTSRAKLKCANQKEKLLKWKEHFKNLLGNSPEITDKPMEKINIGQLGLRMEEELNIILKKIRNPLKFGSL